MVLHLAGNASGAESVLDPGMDFRANALATCNVANACITRSVRKLVFLSSAIVYGIPQEFPMTEAHPTHPFLPYGASKLSAEILLISLYRTFGLPVTIGRPFVVYGPGEDPRRAGGEVSQFLRWHLNRKPIPLVGDPARKTRDFIHVSDLVDALLLLVEYGQPGEVFNIGTGFEYSMLDLAGVVGAAIGREATLDADLSLLDDTYRLVPDIRRLREIGFVPKIPLLSGVRALRIELGDHPDLPSVNPTFWHQGCRL